MARKTLLTESELRRFMKLADMRPAGEKRIQEMGARYPGARDEDEELEDELGHEDDIAGDEAGELDVADDELAMDAPMDAPMDDMGMGADEGPPADPDVEAKFAEFMTQVAAVAQEVLGIEVDVEEAPAAGDEFGEEEIEMDPAALDEPAGVPEEGGEELEMGSMGPEEEEEDPDAMFAEVTRRVARRLRKQGRQAEVVDQLAERIMKRLTK